MADGLSAGRANSRSCGMGGRFFALWRAAGYARYTSTRRVHHQHILYTVRFRHQYDIPLLQRLRLRPTAARPERHCDARAAADGTSHRFVYLAYARLRNFPQVVLSYLAVFISYFGLLAMYFILLKLLYSIDYYGLQYVFTCMNSLPVLYF